MMRPRRILAGVLAALTVTCCAAFSGAGQGRAQAAPAPQAAAASGTTTITRADGTSEAVTVITVDDAKGVRVRTARGSRWIAWKGLEAESAYALRGRLLSAPPKPGEQLAYGRWCLRLGLRARAFTQFTAVLKRDFKHAGAQRGILELQGLPPYPPLKPGAKLPELGRWLTPRVTLAFPIEYGLRKKPYQRVTTSTDLLALVKKACADRGVAVMKPGAPRTIAVSGTITLSVPGVSTFFDQTVNVRAEAQLTLNVAASRWKRSCPVKAQAQSNEGGRQALDQCVPILANRIGQAIQHYVGPRASYLEKPPEKPNGGR